MNPIVVSVAKDKEHQFSKKSVPSITLIEGVGVEGDAHAGETVQHLSRIAIDPSVPNLRQVHLIHSELLDELNAKGFEVRPSDLGENITTRGLDLLSLSKGTVLKIGAEAAIEITGLRNPCKQIEKFRPHMLKEVLRKNEEGEVEKRAGIMGVVRIGGKIYQNDEIEVILPQGEPMALVGV
ncbi:MOSC domain-containing protein [Pelagicoccus enzymogenes]|uniref:MOSC domain-containing protein n=1 Tax=Pelagicoccus enzymogenes TaxID=2773457 RepID=UPI00280D71E2|nr:MOSC domain-containing protein [Pelagicoccus enzymogenes]MDQ8201291.1 MOSC domain-containing protein [Pelagicoccus enzymogenes]